VAAPETVAGRAMQAMRKKRMIVMVMGIRGILTICDIYS
jgi:hypothetical protein